MKTIDHKVIDDLAKRVDDPFKYVLVLIEMKFNAPTQKKLAVKCWNKYHQDKPLPIL